MNLISNNTDSIFAEALIISSNKRTYSTTMGGLEVTNTKGNLITHLSSILNSNVSSFTDNNNIIDYFRFCFLVSPQKTSDYTTSYKFNIELLDDTKIGILNNDRNLDTDEKAVIIIVYTSHNQ